MDISIQLYWCFLKVFYLWHCTNILRRYPWVTFACHKWVSTETHFTILINNLSLKYDVRLCHSEALLIFIHKLCSGIVFTLAWKENSNNYCQTLQGTSSACTKNILLILLKCLPLYSKVFVSVFKILNALTAKPKTLALTKNN